MSDDDDRWEIRRSRRPGYVARRTRSRLPRERYPRQRRQISIEELLGRLLRTHKLTEAMREQCVFLFWRDIVGERIGAITQPEAFTRGGVLRVAAKTSVQIQELQFYKARMVPQINEWIAARSTWLGSASIVSDIRFAIGTVRPIADPDQLDRQRLRQVRRMIREQAPLTDGDRTVICAETSMIEDEALRALVESVRLRWNR